MMTTVVQNTTAQAGTPVWYEGFPDNRMAPWDQTAEEGPDEGPPYVGGQLPGLPVMNGRTGPYPYPVKAPPLGLRGLGVWDPAGILKTAIMLGAAVVVGYGLCKWKVWNWG